MGLLYGILGLVAMIIIHEFGHFIAARMLGVEVIRFSIGFGPVLLRFKPKVTEYALSLIPLGGYVKMKGEEMDERDEQDTKGAFFAQPVWKRIIIVFAGPFFNIASAILFFAFAYSMGVPTLAPQIGKIQPNSAAYKAGIQPNDTIIAINGKKIKTWEEMSNLIKEHPDKTIIITVKRDKNIVQINATPKKQKKTDLLGYKKYVGVLGIFPSGSVVALKYTPIKGLKVGLEKTVYITKVTLVGIVRLIERAIPSNSVGGPIMIVDIASKAAQSGLAAFLMFAAIISINLGILNLLPIPILDGGHLMFFTIEAIRKKPVSKKVQENFQKVGLALLLALMLFAFMNDFKRYGVTKYVKNQVQHIQK
jgi:regulator of sigma E protease